MRLKPELVLLLLIHFAKAGFSQSAETVYLQTDKDIYLPGETIWFKAYFLYNNLPAALTTNFYTAIYDEKGSLLQQKKYPVTEASCNGDFIIPDTFKNTYLQLRAYTKAMNAADSNSVYSRVLRVYQTTGISAPAQTEGIIVSFFAEGGSLVSNISSDLSFKAVFAGGHPAKISGAIKDSASGMAVDSFYTDENGLGTLQFTPEPNKKYYAECRHKYYNAKAGRLPPVVQNGAILHTETVGNKLMYLVKRNFNAANTKVLQLVLQSGKVQLYSAAISLNETMEYVGSVSLDSFPAGIADCQLLDDNNSLLQQKQILVQPISFEPQINSIEKNMAAKGKNILEIVVPDTLLNNLSVSVSDIYFNDQPSAIYENLLLQQYKYIPSLTIAKAVNAHNNKLADLLLLTGDTSYKHNRQDFAGAADNYLSLQFDYRDGNNTWPGRDSLSMVITETNNDKRFYNIKSNGDRSFKQDGLVFYDIAKINYQFVKNKELGKYLQLKTTDGWQVPLQVNPVDKTIYAAPGLPANRHYLNTDSVFTDVNSGSFNQKTILKEVKVKSRYTNPETIKMLELDKKYTSGFFSGIARGHQVNVLDDPEAAVYPDLYSYIIYKVPGLMTYFDTADKIRKFLQFRSYLSKEYLPVTIYLDERQIEYESFDGIYVSQLAYIKYIPGIVIGSAAVTTAGVLYIYTKKGNETSSQSTMHSVKIKGYDMAAAFKAPDYAEKGSLLNPDRRSTLYWNPYIFTDRNNSKIRIEYYNNDISTRHLVVLEGVNEEGRLIHIEKIIE